MLNYARNHPRTKDEGPLVEWEHIGQHRYDRLIEALVAYQHSRGSQIQAIDGRGGDGGIDIDVHEPGGRRVIYQLKYFPEGFDGNAWGDRRSKQIEPSLRAALKHDPDEWVLVAPCVPTPSGWAYIDKLRKSHPDTTEGRHR